VKKIIVFVLLCVVSHAKVYYAKVEPYEIRNISSSVSGVVLYVDENSIGRKLGKTAYIHIDDEIDKKELGYVEDKLLYLQNIINASKKMLQNQQEALVKKRDNYKKIEKLKIKSTVEKDREFYELVNSENQFLSTQKEIENLKVQIADLKLRKVKLEKNISDKTLTAKGFILYDVMVKPGQVVNVSTPLARLADVSKAILTIYLDTEDIKDAKNKVVYINGKKTSYKISRLLNIADSKNISKYMAQIVIKSPKLFSRLVKIELKDEQ